MPRFALDTSCMVPFLCAWHQNYRQATGEIERRVDADEVLVVPAPALIETYAVLTRLPRPYQLSAAECTALIQDSFLGNGFEVVALAGMGYRDLVETAPTQEIRGGRIYDAVILARALEAKADVLLTFNDRHFRSLAGDRIEIVGPSA